MKSEDDKKIENFLRHSISRVFAHVCKEIIKKEYDIVDFFDKFIESNISIRFFNDGSVFSQAYLYIMEVILEELPVIKKNKDAKLYDVPLAFWMGYIVSEYIQLGNDKDILIKNNTFKWLYDGYETLHTQSVGYVIDLILERNIKGFI